MHSARGFLEWWASGPAIIERREDIVEWSHRWVTGARKGRGDMGFTEGRTRFGDGPAMYFAMLIAVLTLLGVLLLAFPARALAAADLKITKQGPARVEPGDKFDYVLIVSNEGEDAAVSVKVTDLLPDGVTLAESDPDICTPVGGSAVTCTPFNLKAGKSKTITLRVDVAPGKVGEVTNRAKVEAVGVPPENSNEVTTTVAPNLVINKLDDPDPVDTEDVLHYTLRVENQGHSNANIVTIRDELPLDMVDFDTVDSADFDCEYKAGIVKCENGSLAPGDIAKVEIVVEPEKAGTIKNRADVFVQGVREPLDTDTETTKVDGGGGNGGGDDNPDEPNEPNEPSGPDVPQGDQCSPVINLDTGDPLEVISGTDPVQGTFKNFYNDTLPLRIAYATSSEDGSLTITLSRKDNGKTILDKTIKGKKKGVLEVDTEAGVTYDVAIVPDNQGYAVDLQIGSGTDEPCTNPDDLDPPGGPGGNDGGNGGNGTNNANDVIDDTISDKPLPDTGGASLLGLAVISLGIAVVGGATVVGTSARRRDR
jgi:uncharacterized repeat protein (TIGR01451 family)